MYIITYLRYAPGEKQFQISFENTIPTEGVRKPFIFDKKDTECIETCMDRTTTNVEIFLSKNINKENGQSILTPTEVCFFFLNTTF